MSDADSEPVLAVADIRTLLTDIPARQELSAPGFRAFLAVAGRWGLNVADQLRLLGGVPASTYYLWKSKGAATLAYDQLERISLVLGIWRALAHLFADEATALRWLKADAADLPFAGSSPLAVMLRGSIDDLYAVRRYLDGWRGGSP